MSNFSCSRGAIGQFSSFVILTQFKPKHCYSLLVSKWILMKLRKICIYRAEFRATTSSAADCESFSRVFLPPTVEQVSRNTKASNENIKLVRLDRFMRADFLGKKNCLRSKLISDYHGLRFYALNVATLEPV